VTNTLPITPEKQFLKNSQRLAIAPLIAKAIHAVFHDDRVNSLFPGHA
jgi:ribose-phosphate pyrophosphokinase